jgi:hypothetical protein
MPKSPIGKMPKPPFGKMPKSPLRKMPKVNAQPRIVGGEVVPPRSVHHLFTVRVLPSKCGGSLISPNFVLSAAHCNAPDLPTTFVVLRDPLDKRSDKILKVISTLNHPKYARKKLPKPLLDFAVKKDKKFALFSYAFYDFAIFKLEMPFKLFGFFPCLPSKNDQFVGKIVTASGWGMTEVSESKNRKQSDVLKYTTLTAISDTECAKILAKQYYGINILNFVDIQTEMGVCADGHETNTSICYGDSGGLID